MTNLRSILWQAFSPTQIIANTKRQHRYGLYSSGWYVLTVLLRLAILPWYLKNLALAITYALFMVLSVSGSMAEVPVSLVAAGYVLAVSTIPLLFMCSFSLWRSLALGAVLAGTLLFFAKFVLIQVVFVLCAIAGFYFLAYRGSGAKVMSETFMAVLHSDSPADSSGDCSFDLHDDRTSTGARSFYDPTNINYWNC